MGVADRVNLGLIPSAEMSYGAACRALRPDTGGVLHIHGNVADADDDREEVGKSAVRVLILIDRPD